MKDLVKKATAVLLFDELTGTTAIRHEFLRIHRKNKDQLGFWPVAASTQKMKAKFWFQTVPSHFSVLLSLSFMVLLCLQKLRPGDAGPLLLFSLLSFLIIISLNYWPIFYGEFLPRLAAIVAEQEAQTTETDDSRKCKRTQYSIPTLTIIFYVWSKMAEIPMVPVNDHSALLLNHLYGCDKDKLKQNLARLYKFSFLSAREKAEMQKGVSTARLFFQELDHPPAGKWLDEMENKLQKA